MRSEPASIQITIVVPVKEYSPNMDITMRSILEQVGVELQVLLILHPNFDSDFSKLEKYFFSPKVKYHVQDQPGLYEAMNQGWTLAEDSLICFMGLGDFFLSNMACLFVLKSFNVKAFHGLIWGYGPWLFLDSELNIIFSASDQSFKTSELLKTSTPICHQTVFMSKALIEKLDGFDTSFIVASDRDLLDRAAQISVPKIWSQPITAYVDGGFSSVNQAIGHKELEYLQDLRKNVRYRERGFFENLSSPYKAKQKEKKMRIKFFSWLPENILRYLND